MREGAILQICMNSMVVNELHCCPVQFDEMANSNVSAEKEFIFLRLSTLREVSALMIKLQCELKHSKLVLLLLARIYYIIN